MEKKGLLIILSILSIFFLGCSNMEEQVLLIEKTNLISSGVNNTVNNFYYNYSNNFTNNITNNFTNNITNNITQETVNYVYYYNNFSSNITYNVTYNITNNFSNNFTVYINTTQNITYNLTNNITNNITNNFSYNYSNNVTNIYNYTFNISNNFTTINNITNNITNLYNYTYNITYNITNNFSNNFTVYINTTQNVTYNLTNNITNIYNYTFNITNNFTNNITYNVTYNITNNFTYNYTYNITNNITYNYTFNISNNFTTINNITNNITINGSSTSSNNTFFVYNVKNYGATGNGVTDDTNAIQSAISDAISDSGGTVYLPIGTYNLTHPLYFNSTSANVQIIFKGDGYKTLLTSCFGTISTGANYSMFVNTHPDGSKAYAYPSSPRVIFENLYFTGVCTGNVSLVQVAETGITMRNVKLQYFYTGVGFTNTYSDRNFFYGVQSQYTRRDGYFYRQANNGDGFYMQGAYFEGGGVYVNKAFGGHMDSVIGGNHYFNNVQNIEISNSHFEMMDYLSWFNRTFITLKNAKTVRIMNNWFGNRYGNKMIEIKDEASTDSGKMYFENNNFVMMCETTDCLRSIDIDFTNVTTSDEFYFKNNYGYFNNIGLTTYEPFGLKVNSSGSSSLRTLLNDQGYLLTGGEVNLKYDAQSSWRIARTGQEDLLIYNQLGQPSISYIGKQTSASYHGGIASGVNYFYKVGSLDRGYWTNTSIWSNQTVSSDNSAIEMTINARNIPSVLRFWRGTTNGTGTAYVDIPVNEYIISIFDQGNTIGGYAWITSAIPGWKNTTNTSNIMNFNGTFSALNISANNFFGFLNWSWILNPVIASGGTGSSNLTLSEVVTGVGNWSLDKPSYATILSLTNNVTALALNDTTLSIKQKADNDTLKVILSGKANIGNCTPGTVLANITTTGIQCVADQTGGAGGGDASNGAGWTNTSITQTKTALIINQTAGDQFTTGNLHIGTDGSDSAIYWHEDANTEGESLFWENSGDQFRFTDALYVDGSVRSANIIVTGYSNATQYYSDNFRVASCDIKAYENNGSLYCGTDSTGAGGGDASNGAGWSNASITTTVTNLKVNISDDLIAKGTYNKIDNQVSPVQDLGTYFTDFTNVFATTSNGAYGGVVRGTGGISAVVTTAFNGTFGVYSISRGTAANSGYQWTIELVTGGSYVLNGSEYFSTQFAKLATTGANKSFGVLGWCDSQAIWTDCTDGLYFYIDNGTVTGKSASNGARTQTPTSLTLVDGLFYTFIIKADKDLRNGTFIILNRTFEQVWTGNVSANIPRTDIRATGGAGIMYGENATGTANIRAYVDYIYTEQKQPTNSINPTLNRFSHVLATKDG